MADGRRKENRDGGGMSREGGGGEEQGEGDTPCQCKGC